MVLDQMTSEERLQALLKGDDVDRVPVIPFQFGHIGIISGLSIADIYEDPQLSYAAQTRAAEMYGYERLNTYGYAAFGAWEFGGEVKLPRLEGEAPMVLQHAVKTPDEAAALTLPDDIMTVGCMPMAWEFSKLQAEHGDPVTFQAIGPLDMAAGVMGVENVMVYMADHPDLLHHVCRVVTDFVLQSCDIWAAEFGGENLMPFCGYAVESNLLISPKHFETFALPYINEVVAKFNEIGAPHCFLHICADQIKNLPLYAQAPWPEKSIFTFGIEMSALTIAEHFPEHVICAPIDPLLMYKGTPDAVLAQGKARMDECKGLIPGLAIAPGCDIPAYSPPVNVYQMVKTSRLYGVY